MPIEINMPRMSDTMEEGTLIKWRVKVGDKVDSGDHLADVETDKATMELQAFDDGTVARIAVDAGQTVPIGALILILAEEGESIEDAVAAAETNESQTSGTAPSPAVGHGNGSGSAVATAPAPPMPGRRIRVSPVARKIAEEHGLDLSAVAGSGPEGRIIKRDVLAAIATTSAAAYPAEPSAPASAQPAAARNAKIISLSNMRKTIARRLVESNATIPDFTVSVCINMDPLLSLRQTLNAQLEASGGQGPKLSVSDFITQAAARAAVAHPAVNSSWDQDKIVQHGTVHVGIAVAVPPERGGGLVVPVLHDVQTMSLRAISEQTRALAQKARQSGLSSDEMAGGTLTVSNLGMYGVDQFTAIINPPQAAILAVGAANKKPVVRDGQITIGHEMIATLSCDHRVLDGASAAEYLQTLRRLLENPAVLLV